MGPAGTDLVIAFGVFRPVSARAAMAGVCGVVTHTWWVPTSPTPPPADQPVTDTLATAQTQHHLLSLSSPVAVLPVPLVASQGDTHMEPVMPEAPGEPAGRSRARMAPHFVSPNHGTANLLCFAPSGVPATSSP